MKQTKLTSVNFSKTSPLSISGKFVSNLAQNYNMLYLMTFHTLRIFLRHCSMMGHSRQTIVVLVNFPKKFPFQAKGQFGPNLAQNYSTFYLMICQSCFFLLKHFSMMEHKRLIKVTLVSFPQNFPFSTIVDFKPTLCNLMSQTIMSHDSLSKNCKMQYDGVPQLD